MKSKSWLILGLLVLGGAAAVAIAQPAPGRGMMGGGNPAICATEKYVFVLRGNTLLQLDINTLEIIKQKELDGMGPRGEMGNPRDDGARERDIDALGRRDAAQPQAQPQGQPGRPRGQGRPGGRPRPGGDGGEGGQQ